jgi:hypothetical protein
MENNKIPGTIENWENGKLGRDIRFAKVNPVSDSLVNELLGVEQKPTIEIIQKAPIVVDSSEKITAEIARIRNSGNLSISELAKFFMDSNPVISRKINNVTLFCEFGNNQSNTGVDSEFKVCARIEHIRFNPVENGQVSVVCELKPFGGKYAYVFEHMQKRFYNYSLTPIFAVSNDCVILMNWDIWF